jgi:acetoin utilization deacetylase AcuC-like enzyme
MPKRTGIVRHPIYTQHLAGYPHVESPRRLEVIYEALDGPDMKHRFVDLPPREADEASLARVHSRNHIRRVAATAGKPQTSLDPDTQTTAMSYQAAKMAVGGLFVLIDAVFEGAIKNGFALVRPPGHHAESDRAMGFCLFNNVACAAKYAMHEYDVQRILIVDWDIHHGNATQKTFYDDQDVLYFSTHQYPHYPGSGSLTEVGRSAGEGFTINVPLSPGQGDAAFFQIFKKILVPVAESFRPELILISAGFDTYVDDPLGGMNVTAKGYRALTRIMMDLAETYCSGRLVVTLEGGYHLGGLQISTTEVLRELSQEGFLTPEEMTALETAPEPPVIKEVIGIHSDFWPNL